MSEPTLDERVEAANRRPELPHHLWCQMTNPLKLINDLHAALKESKAENARLLDNGLCILTKRCMFHKPPTADDNKAAG